MLRNKAVNQALELGTIYVSGWYLGLGGSNTPDLPLQSHSQRGALGDIPTCSVFTATRADGSDLVRNFIYCPISYFSSPTWYSEGQFSSVTQSCPTLWPHELQHARPLCPSPTPGVHLNSCPSSQWCHPAISSSVVPFSSCPQSLPASESFPMNQFFTWGGQSIGVSASASVLAKNTQDWSPLGWTGWISLQSKGLSSLLSSKASILWRSAFFTVQLSHPYMTTGKITALTRWTFVSKVMSLLLNMLSRLVITFLLRSKHLLISWLQSPSGVILEPQKIKSATVSPPISHEVMGPDTIILVFWTLSFKPIFHSPLSLSLRGFLVPLHFLA